MSTRTMSYNASRSIYDLQKGELNRMDPSVLRQHLLRQSRDGPQHMMSHNVVEQDDCFIQRQAMSPSRDSWYCEYISDTQGSVSIPISSNGARNISMSSLSSNLSDRQSSMGPAATLVNSPLSIQRLLQQQQQRQQQGQAGSHSNPFLQRDLDCIKMNSSQRERFILDNELQALKHQLPVRVPDGDCDPVHTNPSLSNYIANAALEMKRATASAASTVSPHQLSRLCQTQTRVATPPISRQISCSSPSSEGMDSFVELPSSPPRPADLMTGPAFFPERRQNVNMQPERPTFRRCSLSLNDGTNSINSSDKVVTSRVSPTRGDPGSATRKRKYQTSTKANTLKTKLPKLSDNNKKELELDAASVLCSLSRVVDSKPSDLSSQEDSVRDDTTAVSISDSSTTSKSESSYQLLDKPCPTRLSMPNDESELNSLHCFVREQLLELFIIPRIQDEESSQAVMNTAICTPIDSNKSTTNNKNISDDIRHSPYGGRVGFRCVHCAHCQPSARTLSDRGCTTSRIIDPEEIIQNSNAPMGTFYPKSLSELYRLVCTWQRVHFQKCKHIPAPMKKMYSDLKASDKTRGKTKYWVTSAIELGLENDIIGGGCIRYAPKI